MKWKNTKIIKMVGGLFGNHHESCRAINVNADVLQECCNHIKILEEKVEELEKYNSKLSEIIGGIILKQ